MNFIAAATQTATASFGSQIADLLAHEDATRESPVGPAAASPQPTTTVVPPPVASQDILNFPVPVGVAQPGVADPLAGMADLQVPPLPQLVDLQTIMGPGPQTMTGPVEITPLGPATAEVQAAPPQTIPVAVAPQLQANVTAGSGAEAAVQNVVGGPAAPLGVAAVEVQAAPSQTMGIPVPAVVPQPQANAAGNRAEATVQAMGGGPAAPPQSMGIPMAVAPQPQANAVAGNGAEATVQAMGGPAAAEAQVAPSQTMGLPVPAVSRQLQAGAAGNGTAATVLQASTPIPVSPAPQATKPSPESPPQYQAEESQAEGAAKVGPTRTKNSSFRVSFKTPGDTNHRVENSGASIPISEFQRFIPNVSWQDEFFLGAGINAFTGQAEPRAVVKFDLPPSGTKHSQETLSIIRYETNLIQELAASAGAGLTLNIGPIGLGVEASSSILSRAKVSATSSSILATYTTTYDSDFDPAHQLTPEAAELARRDPEEFRRSYGDYFIAGGQRKSTFTALLVYSCSHLETLHKFTTQVSTNVSELFKLVGSGEWMNNAKEEKVDFKIFVEMRGYVGSAPTAVDWDPSKLLGALNWFKANEVGVWSTARLQHYSTLDQHISRAIPIRGEIFKDIKRLHSLLQSIILLAASCPQTVSPESTKLVQESNEFRDEVETHRSSLAQDEEIRSSYLENADKLYEKLTSIHRRYMFWIKVLNEVPSQPPFRHINATNNQKVWSYGISVYPEDPSIEILSTSQSLALPRSVSPFKRNGTLSYAGKRLIVGWKVKSRQDSHHGSWRRLASDILLSTTARVVFRSERFRPSEWELVTYHVDQALYNFNVEGVRRPKLGEGNDERTEKDPGSILRDMTMKK